jgi:hypothetical protein
MAAPKRAKVSDVMPVDVMPVDGMRVPPQLEGAPPLVNGRLTVNGNPVDPMFEHAIPYANTDQGRYEANFGKPEPSGVKVTRDAWDGMLDQRVNEPWSQHDPLSAEVDRVRKPGTKYRFLSPRVCDKASTRGWQKTLDKDGREVKVGNLFLGEMPVEMAERRNAHYREVGNDDLRKAEENYTLEQERSIRNSGSKGLAPLRRGELLQDHRDPEHGASIGFEQTRGF